MSTGIDIREHIGQAKCPECKWSHMNIYNDGTFHCGKCGSGGMLICTDPFKGGVHTHEHIIKKFKKTIANPLVANFSCGEKHGQNKCPKFD